MWLTNKDTGGVFNTDWLDKERQISINKAEANKLNEMDKVVHISRNHMKEVSEQVLRQTENTIISLNDKYPEVANFLNMSSLQFETVDDDKYGIMSTITTIQNGNISISKWTFNKNDPVMTGGKSLEDYCKQECGSFYMDCSEDKYSQYLFYHEYGHIVQNYLLSKEYSWKDADTTTYTARTKNMAKQLIATAKKNNIKLDMKELSMFALKKLDQGVYTDLFAECFANMHCGKSNCWGDAMKAFLKEKGLVK